MTYKRQESTLLSMLFLSNFQQLYMNFVKNAKFMSPKTKPVIAFMQNSLVEIFSLDDRLTYQHGFVYIRQLAIHLRNAILQKKKVLFAHPPSFLFTEDSVGNVLWHCLACRDLGYTLYIRYNQEKMKGYRVPRYSMYTCRLIYLKLLLDTEPSSLPDNVITRVTWMFVWNRRKLPELS